jgi:S-DNA-T family DNA segregation ATPase FtsK/SpoIIIE
VELGQYNDVPHLLTRVITNPKKAADALQWVVREMDRRYDLLAAAEVRDIDGFYDKYDAGGLDPSLYERFPFIVVVIDELNDLMMVAGRAVEEAVVRIAQMARAVGIHLVIATQRPSVDVITGVIKANIPSRMAFSVASQTDSRVILDMAGAEKLVGLGDMILVTAREPRPERIQGAFVTEGEIHAVVDWVRAQDAMRYEESVLEAPPEAQGEEHGEYEGEDPEIMRQAIEAVVRSQLGSTSMLQRKLRIGFARAGRVMDILEHMGIVGPSEGSKARAVLVAPEELDQVLGVEPVRR